MAEVTIVGDIDRQFVAHCTSEGLSEIEYVEPGVGCAQLCYDCEKGTYCWDSDNNEDKIS